MWTQEEGDALVALAGEELQPLYAEGLSGNHEKGKALGLQEWEFALALQFHKDAKPNYSMFEHILYSTYGVLRYKRFEKIKDESRYCCCSMYILTGIIASKERACVQATTKR